MSSLYNPREGSRGSLGSLAVEMATLFQSLNQLIERSRLIVSVLGGVQVNRNDELYRHAKEMAYYLGQARADVLTGGGPGIMEAVNQGVQSGGGRSIAIVDSVFDEKDQGSYTEKLACKHLFLRRYALLLAPHVTLFYPGSIGTLDEYMGSVLNRQEKLSQAPAYLIQSRRRIGTLFENKTEKPYWEALQDFFRSHVNGKYTGVNPPQSPNIINIEAVSGKALAKEIVDLFEEPVRKA